MRNDTPKIRCGSKIQPCPLCAMSVSVSLCRAWRYQPVKRHIMVFTAQQEVTAEHRKTKMWDMWQDLLFPNLKLSAVYQGVTQLAISCKLHVA